MKEGATRTFIATYWKYITFFIFFMLVCYVMLYRTYENVKKELIENLNARQMIHAKLAAKGIETFFNNHIAMLQNLAKNEHILDLDNNGKRILQEFYWTHSRDLSIISRVDSRGRILHSEPYDKGVVGQTVSRSEDFREAKRTGDITVSDVFTNKRGFKTIILHVPVFKQGSFDGTLALLFPFNAVAKRYVEDIKVGTDGYAWVVSRNGIELSCPVPGHVGHSVFVNCKDFPDILAMAQRMIRGEQGVATYEFNRIRENVVSKVTKQAVFMPVRLGNNFWSIVVATPEDEVLDAMKGFRDRFLLIALLFVIGIGFLLYMLFRNQLLVKEIEKRQLTEEALRESEEKYRQLFMHAPAAIFEIDYRNRRFVRFNDIVPLLTGYAREELLSMEPWDLYTEKSRTASLERMMKIMEGREVPVASEYEVRKKDGGSLWVLMQSNYRLEDGILASAQVVAHDITERKRMEEALRRSEELRKAVFDSVKDFIFIKDLNRRYILVNDFFLKHFHADSNVFIGKTDPEIPIFENKQDTGSIECDTDSRVLQGETVEYQITHQISGTRITFDLIKTPFRDSQGNVTGICGLSRDVTERRRLEAVREVLEERLRRSEKMESLGMLAGGVAHDLNNILGVMMGYSELMLLKFGKDDPLREHVRNILTSSERAAAIVQDMLTLARRGVVAKKVVKLDTIIGDQLNTLEYMKFSSHYPRVWVKTELAADLLNIKGSPVHLGKTVMNLLSNAAEAIRGEGTVILRTENRYLDRPVSGYDDVKIGDYVVMTVSDTGEGISPGDLKRIFEPFYTKKIMGKSGTGLGLSVVWGTVKDHEGYIDVESRPGMGTTFTLYFPVTREEAEQEVPVPPADYMGRGETLLVVDDVREQRELATRMLAGLHYKVETVSGGEEAVEYLKEHDADLVILDMIMDPGMDGLETYRGIIELKPGQKAVIVSGFAETERVRKAQELGAGPFVKKPYILEKIGLAVRRELDRKTEKDG